MRPGQGRARSIWKYPPPDPAPRALPPSPPASPDRSRRVSPVGRGQRKACIRESGDHRISCITIAVSGNIAHILPISAVVMRVALGIDEAERVGLRGDG